jgi:hypothetical protein
MSSDEKVLDFPRVEVTPEENARRVTVEATRLASLAPGEWRLWIDHSADRLRIPRATLQGLIVAIIKDSEKKARDAETAARRQELAVRGEQERKQREQERIDRRAEQKRKEKEKAFESLISLPSEQQETRLGELAKRLDEDVAVIRDHFTAFVGMQGKAASAHDHFRREMKISPVWGARVHRFASCSSPSPTSLLRTHAFRAHGAKGQCRPRSCVRCNHAVAPYSGAATSATHRAPCTSVPRPGSGRRVPCPRLWSDQPGVPGVACRRGTCGCPGSMSEPRSRTHSIPRGGRTVAHASIRGTQHFGRFRSKADIEFSGFMSRPLVHHENAGAIWCHARRGID